MTVNRAEIPKLIAYAPPRKLPTILSADTIVHFLDAAPSLQSGSRAGMVMINLPTTGMGHHVTFGGRNGASYVSRLRVIHTVQNHIYEFMIFLWAPNLLTCILYFKCQHCPLP